MTGAESDPSKNKLLTPRRIISTALAAALAAGAGAGYGFRTYQDYRDSKPLCFAESTYSAPNAKFKLAWLAAALPNNRVITIEADEMNNQADLPEVRLWSANDYVPESDTNPNSLQELRLIKDDGRIHDISLPVPGLEQYVFKISVDTGDHTIQTNCELQPGIHS